MANPNAQPDAPANGQIPLKNQPHVNPQVVPVDANQAAMNAGGMHAYSHNVENVDNVEA